MASSIYESSRGCIWRRVEGAAFASASPFVALVVPILPSIAPSLGTSIFAIITIPIPIYRSGDGDDRFCGDGCALFGALVGRILVLRRLVPVTIRSVIIGRFGKPVGVGPAFRLDHPHGSLPLEVG